MNVDFEFGEKKHIKLRICSCKGTDFLIERASYELLYKGTQEVEDSGIAAIQGHILDVVIQPQKKGRYKLRVMYEILDEKLIAEVEVMVK